MSSDEPQPRKCCVAAIRIRGLAERADSPEQPLGPGVIVPESVPLRIESSSGETVGTARLRRDAQGIWAEAEIPRDTGRDRVPSWHHSHHPADLWPHLAVGVTGALSENGVITSGGVACVCLVRANIDPGLPPWEVVTDPPGECGRCGSTLEYRDRFLRQDRQWTSDKVPEAFCPHCEDDWSHLNQLYYMDLNMCGCGNPESAYDLIRDILALAPFYEDQRWKTVRGLFGYAPGSEGAYHIVLSALTHAELLEHGGSVGGSWITKKGKHYLSLLRLHEWDNVDEEGLPHDGRKCGPGCRHWEASAEDWQKRELAKGQEKA